jgi:hypothetical protein
MLVRTDAARRIIFVSLLLAGCAQVPQRQSARLKAPAGPPVPLSNNPSLAITTPQTGGDVQLVSGQVQPVQATTVSQTESDPVRRLQRDAANAYAKVSCYIARMRRREVVQGRPKPEEIIVFKFREKPYSVHFKWLGDEGHGREVVFVRGRFDDKLHILTAANDIPFTPAGRRLDLSPDSIMVRAASKYPITEAGIGNMIGRFGRMLDAVHAGGSGITVKYLGPVQLPEYPTPLEGVECQFPPGREPEIPDGGKRLTYFDSLTHFPVVSLTYDPSGREVDFYCFDRFQLDVNLDDDDFNPEKLWGPAKK